MHVILFGSFNTKRTMPTFLLCVLQSGKFIIVLMEKGFAGDKVYGMQQSVSPCKENGLDEKVGCCSDWSPEPHKITTITHE